MRRHEWAGPRSRAGGVRGELGDGADDPGDLDPPVVLAAVVGLLRSGMSASAAWASVGVAIAQDGTPALPWGGDSAIAVGAACRLSQRTGAPLATVLAAVSDHVAGTLEADARREAAAAGPRLSARVLTLLPVFGLLLGALVDFTVVHVIAATPLGWSLVAAATALTLLGRLWMRRMMRSASDAAREV